MKISILSILITFLISAPAMAEKPSSAGKGDPNAEQKEVHQSAIDEKEKMEDDGEKDKQKSKDKSMNKDDKGLEKQKSMKNEQERKELGKGSDTGKEARETHSKKWWKFWE